MKPFFCRIGSKTKIAKRLIKFFPKHLIYVEPFVGSGALLYAKPLSEIEVINDLDKNVINNFKMLKTAEDNPEKYNLRTTLQDMNDLVNSNPKSKTDKMLKNLYLSCNTFSSSGRGKIYKENNGKRKINKINDYKKRLQNVKIFNDDYQNIIKKYDSKDTFFFIDPPYENSEDLYDEGSFNFENLRNVISNIKGYAMITLNDSYNIRTIFKDFVIKPIVVKGKNRNVNIGEKDRKELIIMNYKLQ